MTATMTRSSLIDDPAVLSAAHELVRHVLKRADPLDGNDLQGALTLLVEIQWRAPQQLKQHLWFIRGVILLWHNRAASALVCFDRRHAGNLPVAAVWASYATQVAARGLDPRTVR